MIFTVEYNRHHGCTSTRLEFNTVRINGMAGQPDRPAATKGMLKKADTIRSNIRYVRTRLPASHKLAGLGWIGLPDHVWVLPNEVAMPSE
jgi:hypothetical protein